MQDVPGLSVEMAQLMEDLIGDLTSVPQPIEVKLFADDQKTLLDTAGRVAEGIAKIPGVVDVRNGINPAGDSLDVEIDQVKAAISAQWRPMFRKPSEIRGSCPIRYGSSSVALTRSSRSLFVASLRFSGRRSRPFLYCCYFSTRVSPPRSRSWSCPLLAVCAVFIGLWVTGIELNIKAMMGMTMIVGIVTEVAIFFFSEFFDVAAGRPVSVALVEAGQNRMRPIAMTTLAAILTLLPLALAIGQGSSMQQPLAVAIISGLVVQFPLVLLVMPSIFLLLRRAP
jgi:multidrug efflux pump subunit AcrB